MIVYIIAIYFTVLLIIGRFTARRSTNSIFYRGERQSPWYLVAFGMVGASISGVSFVSVPGMVLTSGMTYLHMCLGFILGYIVVARVLLPVYYRLNLTSIYTMLQPLGLPAYKTGAAFFLLSKTTGAAARFYVPCFIIAGSIDAGTDHAGSFSAVFPLTVLCMVALIWIYTRRGGIKTLVWTDSLQTLCMFSALMLIIYSVATQLHPDLPAMQALGEAFGTVLSPSGPWLSSTVGADFSWSQFVLSFLSGVFIVIVMTGLDQDMMQKNLTCRSLRDAQKDMTAYGFAFLPANLLFLSLGAMLCLLCQSKGMSLPERPDSLLTMFATTGELGQGVVVLFALGIVAAAFSSADSALTALTTCFCVDIMQRPDDERLRRRAHIGIALCFVVCIMLFHTFNSTSLINAIYTLCSYTYGPLLGLFTYALVHKGSAPLGRGAIAACVCAPLLCLVLDTLSPSLLGYKFGYELLMLNGLFTYLGLRVAHAAHGPVER